MTGNEIRDLRQEMNFDNVAFAELVGTHLSTVLRWEACGMNTIKMDPLQNRIVTLVFSEFRRRSRQRERARLTLTLRDALAIRSTLGGLHVLLNSAFGEFAQSPAPAPEDAASASNP